MKLPSGAVRAGEVLPALGILLIVAVTWAFFVGRTGFHWDDWPILWVYDDAGIEGIRAYFSADRPLYGHVYSVLMPVLGHSSGLWVLLLLTFLVLTGIAWFGFLTDLWPRARLRAWLATGLLIVFPGFVQHGIAFAYSQHFVSSFLFVLSLRASYQAGRSEGWWAVAWSLVAGVTAASSYFLIEYFIGIELARPYVLWLGYRRRPGNVARLTPRAIGRMGLLWVPTLVPFVAFLAFQFVGQDTLEYRNAVGIAAGMAEDPLGRIAATVATGFANLIASTVLVWARPFDPQMVDFGWGLSVVASWVVLVVVAVLVSAVAIALVGRAPPISGTRPGADDDLEVREGVLLAVLMLLTAGLPAASAGLLVDLDTPARDRFSMPLMFGSSLLVALLVTCGARRRGFAIAAGALLIGAAAGFQFRAANDLRVEWERQRDLVWQLAWRLPTLRPGTTVLVEGLPPLLSANQAAGHLNLLYGDAGDRGDLDYFIVDLDHDIARRWVPVLAEGESTEGHLRRFAFAGNTSLAVVAWIPPEGSLRVLTRGTSAEIPGLGDGSRAAAGISNPARALRDTSRLPELLRALPAGPMLRIMGPEPSHDWAFHFQKAELARDLGDWNAVVDLENTVTARGLEPVDPSEWSPFIEARLRRGEVRAAAVLTERAIGRNAHLLPALDSLWGRVAADRPALRAELAQTDSPLAKRLDLP